MELCLMSCSMISKMCRLFQAFCGRRGSLMVSELNARSNGLVASPRQGHCVVFLGKTLDSHSTSLHPGV